MRSKFSVVSLPGLIIFACLLIFAAYFLINNQTNVPDTETAALNIPAIEDNKQTLLIEEDNADYSKPQPTLSNEYDTNELEITSEIEDDMPPPGKDLNYRLNSLTSTDFLIDGNAKSDIGEMAFNSTLLPSNEVKLSLKLKQAEKDDIELVAYFDLAYFTMELDGGNSVLNKQHKELLKLTSLNLQPTILEQYQDYDIPEHALMLVQMLEYWSVSPEGFVHEKRKIVSE